MGLIQRICVLFLVSVVIQGCSARGGGSTSSSAPATPSLSSIQIGSGASHIAAGTTKKYTATGLYSDGTKSDITDAVTWASSDTHAATILNATLNSGVATALNFGQTQISASLQGVSSSATLTVSSATLTQLQINSSSSALAVGADQQLTATALFSDGTEQDVTDSSTWGSSDSTITTVQDSSGSKGRLRGIAHGQATAYASFMGTLASVGVSVSSATIQNISVVPDSLSFAKGTAIGVKAIAVFSDNSVEDVTQYSGWSSSNTTILSTATVPPSNQLAIGVGSGSTQLSATYLGMTGTVSLTVSSATLDSVQIEVNEPVVAKGLNRHLKSVGIFSDGSKQDITLMSVWTSASAGIAAVDNSGQLSGLVTGISAGDSSISASAMNKSASQAMRVSSATVNQLSLSPASPTFAVGSTISAHATALLSDHTSQEVTTNSFWTVADVTFAQRMMGKGGDVSITGIAAGSSNLSAVFEGISAVNPFTVSSATPTALNVMPASTSIATGTAIPLKAKLVFSDGSSQDVTSFVTWSTSSTTSVSVSNVSPAKGLVRGLATGSSTITASYLGLTATSAIVDSTATIASIAVTPANLTLAKGTRQQLSALATFSDGSTQDITALTTWSVAASTVASVGNLSKSSGRVDALAPGGAVVSAKYAGVSGNASLTVTSATLQTLSISPANSSIAKNASQQFSVSAKFSDGTSQDVTDETTWISSNTATAAISNVDGQRGLAAGISAGSATISAYYGQANASAALTILPASIASIEVTPASPSIHVGDTQQFTATVHYSDSTSSDVTALVSWGSSNTSVATISNASGSAGLAQAKVVGTSTVSAIYSGYAGSTVMTVAASGP